MRFRENKKLLGAYFVPVCVELRPKCSVSDLEARLLIFSLPCQRTCPPPSLIGCASGNTPSRALIDNW